MSVIRAWSPGRFLAILALLLAAVVSIFPFYWMIVGTTLNPNDVLRGILLPGHDFVSNWLKAVKNYNLPLFFHN